MNYKLLALDIDNTIVEDGKSEPSQRVFDILQKAAEKVKISLITARSETESFAMIKYLRLDAFYHAIENGAKIVNPKGEMEYDLHIPHSEVQQILDVSKNLFDGI